MNAFRLFFRTQNTCRPVSVYRAAKSSAARHYSSKQSQVEGISASEYSERRTKLFERLLERSRLAESLSKSTVSSPNVIAVFSGSTTVKASHEVPYLFRQDSNLRYLSGFNEPDAILVVHNATPASSSPRSVLFASSKDAHAALWNGASPSERDILLASGVDSVLTIEEYTAYIASLLSQSPSASSVFMQENSVVNLNPRIREMVGVLRRAEYTHSARVRSVADPVPDVHELRATKSPAEVRLIREACRIAALAIRSAMQHTRPGVNENAIWGVLEGESRWHGSDGLSYPPVIAGGNRANTLHYINNNQELQNGQLLLIDAGCIVQGYTSDLTRTYPVRDLSDGQRTVYEAVQDTQTRLASFCRAGVSMHQMYCVMHLFLAAHLRRLGLITSSVLRNTLHDAKQVCGSTSIEAQQLETDCWNIAGNTDGEIEDRGWTVNTFCPHDAGHHLGLDLHDCSTVSRLAPLRSGAVITIEPGLYFRDCADFRSHSVASRFVGIGVRVEDDALVTENGCELLSRLVPTSLEQISKLLGTVDR